MLKKLLCVSLPFAVLSLSSAPAALADSGRPVGCELVVDGKTYIDKTCQMTSSGGGDFQIDGGDYFAQVDVTGPGAGQAHWNGQKGATHAQAPLGDVRRDGACWVNARTRICARALPAAQQTAIVAAQPAGGAFFPTAAPSACLGVEGPLREGSVVVLHDCRLPNDNLFVRRADASLAISRRPDLCLDLEAPGMSKPPELVLLNCRPGMPTWTSAATSVKEAPIRSSQGLCLAIPKMATPSTPFPYAVVAVSCARAGDQAVPFIYEK